MNPELERLLTALAARDNASPAQFPEADAEVERLLQPLGFHPRVAPSSCGQLQGRYRAYLKAAERPPSLPLSA